ncbi:MAG TPA: hypothetical protein PKB01_09410 [Xanthobacteraceae bacterium]|nr:hypothetical protein [Xanthobacteraceae bacterium]
MSAPQVVSYLDELNRVAIEANVAEDEFRRNITSRIRELEEARAFAFRRLNLMKSVSASVVGAKDEEEAKTRGSAAFLQEVGWSGGSQSQAEVVAHFAPVALAIWNASKTEATPDDAAKIAKELAGFESWYAQGREEPFLKLMQQEPLELPLVEVA